VQHFTNGAQNSGDCPLGDASITCWVIGASMISEMKQLQVENARLKRMYADVSMQNELIKEALAKK
jgi:hypothetical protein